MASSVVENLSELHQLFRDISLKFSPAESEDVVQSLKRIYGEEFKSLANQDLLSCLDRLYEFGYVTGTKLTLIKKFIATRSSNENDINQRIEEFETSHPLQPEPEKELSGRTDEVTKITEKLKMMPFVNLYGSAGVGKTTLAKEIGKRWEVEDGKYFYFDLRNATDLTSIYVEIMGALNVTPAVGVSWKKTDYVVQVVHERVKKESAGQPVLFLLDNVEQFSEEEGKEGKNLKTQFIIFLEKLSQFKGETGTTNMLLISRTQLTDSEKVTGYVLQPLEESFSEKILLPEESPSIEAQKKKKLLGICKGVPLLLKGTAAILKQRRKSPNDLISLIETSSQKGTGAPVKSKLEEDSEEKPFDFEEEGVDEGQMSIIREMFYSLPSDSLRVSAVSVSLFHGPFSTSTAAKILGVSISEAVAQLEGLVTNEIIHVAYEDAKQLMYDIHPLLRKYAESIKHDVRFCESYTEAKGRFYVHFMSRVRTVARFLESDYIRAFTEFKRDRPNYEFVIDMSLLSECFSVPGGYSDGALTVSLFIAMFSRDKLLELFHSWAVMCKDDGKSSSLFRALLLCWEARLVSETQGAHKAFDVLQMASLSLEQVDDQSTESFKVTRGLFLYVEGEIHYQGNNYQKAIECLRSSLDLMEGPLKLDTILIRCYNALGNCYYGRKRPDKALEFYNKALKMREELSGSKYHYDMPVYKNQIGTVHEDKGEYDEAVKCYTDALELLEELKCLGYEDEALFRRNLANVYVRQEKYKEANKEARKAYKIRLERLGDHPDTVRSIFQLGVIKANLKAYDKALDFFLKAWKMEKLLGSGNHSQVWRLIIKGVFDMYDQSLENKGPEKENFRLEALSFCERFWKGEKASSHFSFTVYNKEIIDAILCLLRKKPSMFRMMGMKERALIVEYEREALWFYDSMQKATEDDFNNEFDEATDSKVLNDLLRDRTELLDRLIEFCSRREEHEKLLKHKKGKMELFKKVLVRSDFVGEKKQKKSTLKKAVEELCEDVGEKGSIEGFRESLLETWQQQWEEGEGAEETKEFMVARKRLIKGILKLSKELGRKDLCKRYGEEFLSFGERLWEIRHSEMEPSVMQKFLSKLKDLASSIGEGERVKVYLAALQDLWEKKQPTATLKPKEKKPLFKPPLSHLYAEEENGTTKVETEAGVKVVSAQGTEVVLQGEPTEESAGVAVEESTGAVSNGGSDEQVEVESETETESESEDYAEGEKEDVEVHEQVAELAGVEAMRGFLEGSEEESGDETETYGDDAEGQNVTAEESGGIVTSEGIQHWPIKRLGVHVMFPPDAVSEPTSMVVHRWENSVRSPPLQEHEAITSNVIELFAMARQGLKFNTKVKLSLSHSATELRGYELVIKKLIDKETNIWEDVEGTIDIRCREDIEDDCPSHTKIPDIFFPVAQVDITECSTYAVVCRLKSSPTYTITSSGGSFSHPDYPGVTVIIPENAVAPTERFPVELKVQEVSNEEFEGESIIIGPVLRITRAVQFLRLVTIQLPISLRGQEVLNPDPTVYRVRVLFLKTEDKMKKWIEITGDLPEPPSFDGKFVRFQVDRFCRYSYFLDGRQENSSAERLGITSFLSRFIWNQPKPAIFVAYFCRDFPDILYLICCPPHLKRKVMDELEDKGITPYDGASKKNMIPGEDKAFVSVSEGIRPYKKKDIGQVFLKLEDFAFKTELRVRPNKDKDIAVVKFWTTLKPTGRKFPLCKVHLNLSTQGIDRTDLGKLGLPSTAFAGDVKKGIPTDEELEDLSENIPDHWIKLGRRLGFNKELQEFDKGHDKLAEKAYAMLIAWKEKGGSAATYRVLNKALCDIHVKRRDLAQQFCCY